MLRFDWTTRCFLHPAGCRCSLLNERVRRQVMDENTPAPEQRSFAISALTLLLLATHDGEESGEGRYNDQRDRNGHGADRPRPGGVNWNKHSRLMNRTVPGLWLNAHVNVLYTTYTRIEPHIWTRCVCVWLDLACIQTAGGTKGSAALQHSAQHISSNSHPG